MINIIRNLKKRKSKRKLKTGDTVSFRIKQENVGVVNSVCNTTDLINKSIYFYQLLNKNPKKILTELKFQNPELYKKIGRKKFK